MQSGVKAIGEWQGELRQREGSTPWESNIETMTRDTKYHLNGIVNLTPSKRKKLKVSRQGLTAPDINTAQFVIMTQEWWTFLSESKWINYNGLGMAWSDLSGTEWLLEMFYLTIIFYQNMIRYYFRNGTM